MERLGDFRGRVVVSDARVTKFDFTSSPGTPVLSGLREVTRGVTDVMWGRFCMRVLVSASASGGRPAFALWLVRRCGLRGALLNQSQDFPPPRHYTTAHSSCGSTFLMLNFSPLIPAIIIMVIIIYGVLTEGLATRQIKRCCDMCLQLLRLPPPPPFVLEDSERLFYPLLGLGWVFTGQSFSRAWVCSTYNRISVGAGKIQFLGATPHPLSQNLRVSWGAGPECAPQEILRSQGKSCSGKPTE